MRHAGMCPSGDPCRSTFADDTIFLCLVWGLTSSKWCWDTLPLSFLAALHAASNPSSARKALGDTFASERQHPAEQAAKRATGIPSLSL